MPSHLALLIILTFTVFQPDETVRRYGGSDHIWQLETMHGAPVTNMVTLSFPARNTVAGQAPCNSYQTTNTTPYPWIEFGPIAATRMACPSLAVETAFFGAMERATIVLVDGDTLTLSDDSAELLVFTARD